MPTSEPAATALLLTICGVLLAVSVLSSRASERIGGIPFNDYRLAFRMGSVALALILFDGGLNTPMEVIRRVWAPAGMLASIGVLLIAGLVAGLTHLGGLGWPEALVL